VVDGEVESAVGMGYGEEEFFPWDMGVML